MISRILLVFLIVFLFANDSNAARGGKNAFQTTLTISMVTDLNGDGLPNWGDTVTFHHQTTYPYTTWLDLICYQNEVLVYGASTGYADDYPWPWTRVMSLGSGAWTGGRADCTASLYYFSRNRRMVLAQISFFAEG